MNLIYKIKDWTSASRMKNSINSRLKIDVGILRGDGENASTDTILGYSITVYDDVNSLTQYKFYVECDNILHNVWSLTSEEAIKVLNKIGFNCEYDNKNIILKPEVKKTLTALAALGYTYIFKDESEVYISGRVSIRDPFTPQPKNKLSEITEYNYNDYYFLDTTPESIQKILEY